MIRLKGASSIRHFQQAHGLKASGHLDAATSRKVRVHNSNARSKGGSSPAPKPQDPFAPAVKQAVNLKYGPQIQAAQGQVRASAQQLANVDHWYQDYVNQVEAAKQQANSAYQQASGNVSGYGQQAQAQDTAAQAQLAAQMRADAASRGASVDPGVQAQGNQAAASRSQGIATMLTQLGAQGANAQTALASRGATAIGAKAGALVAETNRGRALKTALGQLQSQKGDYGQQVRQQLVKDQLNAEIAQKGLGIKTDQLKVNRTNANTSAAAERSLAHGRNVTAKQNAAKIKQTSRHQSHQDKVAQQNANTNKFRATHPKAAKGTKPKAETAASQKYKHNVDIAVSTFNRLRGSGLSAGEAGSKVGKSLGFKAGQKLTGPQISEWAHANGADPVILNIARDLVYRGFVSGPNLAALRRAGVRIPKQWKTAPRQPKAPKLVIPGVTALLNG